MIYDVLLILNFSFCVFSIYIILAILSKSRKKLYEPPDIRRRYILGLIGFLAIPSVSLGAMFRMLLFGLQRDNLFSLFCTIACIGMVVTAVQFLIIAKERQIIIKDAVPEDTSVS